ncbi:YsnF/AvaK domain-containing protein, partial [Thermomonospora catenispora]|uniref:YsnF/AvaK domain-containing protein n=1 Tax=Thermomonospora catenispora TaxID=2493090 RepID=UPI00111E2FD1
TVSGAPGAAAGAAGAGGPAATGDRTREQRARRPDVEGDAMTRSEEHLRVGKETRESGRVRLRKYVVTEEEQVTVPVSHEEVRIEREPITEENRDEAMSGQDLTESEHEVILHEERPVVSKETTPVERVRATKETITEQQTVGGQVRKERIEVEEDDERARRRGRPGGSGDR